MKKYLNKFLSVLLIMTLVGSFFMKTIIGQILVGIGCFSMVIAANAIYFTKKDGPIRFLIYSNIMLILLILCIISNVFFKRGDLTLYSSAILIIFGIGFEIFELNMRRKKGTSQVPVRHFR